MPDRALVLTAGLGTRLRPLSLTRAKAAVPVAGTPLICRILTWLASEGIRHTVLNLHHRPETVTREVGDGSGLGLHVRYSWERRLLGSAGGPRHAMDLMESETFFIVNGDTITDVDLRALAKRHAELGAAVTMALVPNPAPQRYGGVRVDADGWVRGFTRAGQDPGAHHFVGVQLVEAEVFARIHDGEHAESVNGLYRDMTGRIGGHLTAASFHDVGTPVEYVATVRALARDGSPGDLIDARSRVHQDARLVRTVVWADVDIAADVELVDCIVGDGVHIPSGSRFRNAAIVMAGDHDPAAGERREGNLLVAPLDPPAGAMNRSREEPSRGT